jgi:hypothetical protein
VPAKKPRAKRAPRPVQAKKPGGGEGGGNGGKRGLVPKVPLKTN